MAVSLSYAFTGTVNETLSTGVAAADNPIITFSGYNEAATLNASSSVPVAKHASFLGTLTAGALTINLTSLTGANGTVDFTGLKLQFMRIKNLGAAFMTFSEGASNGYTLFAASWSLKVWPSSVYQFYFPDVAPDVAAADCTIDVAGTGTQTFEITLVAG
jgi:hypothetical protein